MKERPYSEIEYPASPLQQLKARIGSQLPELKEISQQYQEAKGRGDRARCVNLSRRASDIMAELETMAYEADTELSEVDQFFSTYTPPSDDNLK